MRILINTKAYVYAFFSLTLLFSTSCAFAATPLTVTASRVSSVYGSALPTFAYTITGFIGSDTQASVCTGAPVLTSSAVQGSPVGTYTINMYPNPSSNWGNPVPANVGNLTCTNYYVAVVNTGLLKITAATLTVTPNNFTVTYGGNLPAFTYNITGFLGTDTAVTSVTGVPTLTTTANTHATTTPGISVITSPIGTYNINSTWGSLKSANYTFLFGHGTLTVTNSTTYLTVTANSVRSVYGATPSLLYTVTGFVGTDTVVSATSGTPSITSTAGVTSSVGRYPITTSAGTFTASANYAGIHYTNGMLTITPATLTVTALNLSVPYGSQLHPYAYSITGFVNSDTQATAVTGVPTVTSTATARATKTWGISLYTAAVGTYPISPTWGSLGAANYAFTFVPGTLIITTSSTPLTISANNLTIANASLLPATLGYTVTGLLGSDTPSTAGTGSPSITTTATTNSPAGTYPIIAAAGTFSAPNYSTVIYINGTLTIKSALPTPTAGTLNMNQPLASTPFGSTCPANTNCNFGWTSENTSVNASCAAGVMNVTNTSYGAGGGWEYCTTYAQSQCNGQASCNLTFSDANCGGNPNAGNGNASNNAGTLVASCSGGTPLASGAPCPTGGTCTWDATPGNALTSLSCPTGIINIQSATYSTGGTAQACTNALAAQCDNQLSCSFLMGNSYCGATAGSGALASGAITAACLTTGTAPVIPPTQPTTTTGTNGWQLVLDDEFTNDSQLNTSLWNTSEYWSPQSINSELGFYSPDALSFTPQGLVITGSDTQTGGPWGQGQQPYTTGIITSMNKFAQTYGYFEMSAELPDVQGAWPAFWIIPENPIYDPSYELDILESLRGTAGQAYDPYGTSYYPNDVAYLTQHCNVDQSLSSQTVSTIPALSSGFHTYALQWAPDAMIWYIDGVAQMQRNSCIPNTPGYVIVNDALGGSWPQQMTGLPIPSDLPAQMIIQYVRVYKQVASGGVTLAGPGAGLPYSNLPTVVPPLIALGPVTVSDLKPTAGEILNFTAQFTAGSAALNNYIYALVINDTNGNNLRTMNTAPMNLSATQSQTLNFSFNTTGLTAGLYTVTVEVVDPTWTSNILWYSEVANFEVQPGPVNGACGTSNTVPTFAPPTSNFCAAGNATAVTGSGPFNWSCNGSNGGTTASCSAPLEVNGACGSSNGATLSSAPTAGLCISGSNTTVTGSGPWGWNCTGSNGGSNASCSASLQATSGGISCPTQTLFWGTNAICYGVAAATSAGSSATVTASGSSAGTATFTCSNGNFELPTSSSCSLGAAFFVSPTGNDSNNGTSSTTPFLTLEKAQTAMENSSTVKTTYLMGGTFNRTQPLALTNWNDGGQSWFAYPGQTPVLDGGGTISEAIASTESSMIIHGLTIQNFASTGIDMANMSGTIIDGNTVLNLQSTSTNQAFIYAHYNFYNSQITHNSGNHNTGPGIVLAAGSSSENISNVLIDSNRMLNTNSSLSDTGGIYVVDRGHNNTGIVISHNIVGNFGPTNTKAIYLDDEASWISVINNIVYGPGIYCLQYHGGNNETVVNNIFDVSSINKIGLYQDDVSSGFTNYGMAGNTFTHNLVYSSATVPGWDFLDSTGGGIALPNNTDNLYYSGNSTYNSTSGTIVDSAPLNANPLFVNAATNNYTLQNGSPASSVGFVGIDASTIGPDTY